MPGFGINSIFIFFGVSSLSIAKTPYALKKEFSISNPERLIEPTFTIQDVFAASAPIWITAWDESQNSVNFSRVLYTRNDHSANVAHWILSIDDFSSTTLTPKSASMTLGICF